MTKPARAMARLVRMVEENNRLLQLVMDEMGLDYTPAPLPQTDALTDHLRGLSKQTLRAMADEFGVVPTGSHPALVNRISAVARINDDGVLLPAGPDGFPLEQFKKATLVEIAEAWGHDSSGTKAILIARLQPFLSFSLSELEPWLEGAD